jgi:hypothetical protein
MAQKAQALLGLERIEQALDALAKGTSLQNTPTRIGRLANTTSPLYGALENLMRQGFIGRKEFESEWERARKANNQ